MSSTTIEDDDEDQQRGDTDSEDRRFDHKDEIPEAHEAAAETTRFAKRTAGGRGVDVSTESESEIPGRGRVLRIRKDERGPTQSAPPARGDKAVVWKKGVGKKAAAAKKVGAAKHGAAAKRAAAAKQAAAPKKASSNKAVLKRAKPAAKKASGKRVTSRKPKAAAKSKATAKPKKKSKK